MPRTEARITTAVGRQVWEAVQAEVPFGDGRMKHGTLALAGYWTGSFTQVQLDEFERRTQRLIRAARKASKAAA